MGAASVADVLARAFRALLPGGRIIISDIMIDDSRTNPSFATLFSLQMLLTSDQGSCFSAADMKAWLLRAGFEAVEEKALPQPLPYKVLSALKPT